MVGLRHMRQSMTEEELIHGESVFPVSLTLITATLPLVIGLAAIVSMVSRLGLSGNVETWTHAQMILLSAPSWI